MSKILISVSAAPKKPAKKTEAKKAVKNAELAKLEKQLADAKAKKAEMYADYKKKSAPLVKKIEDLSTKIHKAKGGNVDRAGNIVRKKQESHAAKIYRLTGRRVK